MKRSEIEKKKYIPIIEKLKTSYPDDWLLLMEIYEIILTEKTLSVSAEEVHGQLKKIISAGSQYSDIIKIKTNNIFDWFENFLSLKANR